MCGRFAQKDSPRAYTAYFSLDPEAPTPNAAARFNVAPTQSALVVRFNPQEKRPELSLLRWGLVPSFAKDTSRAGSLINARSESVAEKASFKAAWEKPRRCIIPADAFYEWRKEGSARQPFAIALKSGAPIGFAGLWEGWKDPASGEWLRTFTILTCPANPLLAHLHERMPVILRQDDMARFLTASDPADLMQTYPQDEMTLWPVSSRVNGVAHDDAALLERVYPPPAAPEAQASLF
ncbi:DUF159 family protein [Azorhizobium oxalatiphilum]|uniref:Abasic site processing protein n=1 Tax=Azorhizobium oxalatiphilum TaxID=980631 RepID=A0A917CB62_9HYPH|nr:SOS response-associated peptidase [Azorhizobium oxalatiphilum]GGF82793.1 DUF159 family protein [Azorhizobium oxalatiphilum]